ncbi:putative membrane insertion protein [Diaporthe ampelina]|uniref:Putative membrane insertion protein n=1 Tax=Diaporthe ampelina TaxID=1214573 RepID=A0A0G2HJB5_9PEZI|nr:putative membrane insertion protein [Diaporthe ampelina]
MSLTSTSASFHPGVHEVTATPWFISLPLVAVVVSAIIRTPLALYTNSVQRRKAKLYPLVQAQYAQIGLGLRRKAVPNVMERVTRAVKTRSKKMFTAFAVNETRSLWGGLISLPVFLGNLEVIRTMCGGPRGLLGSLLYGWQGRDPAPTTASDTASTSAAASSTAPNTSLEPPAADLSSPTDISELASTTASPEVLNPLTLEPSFASGGCLWFPDLLAPDTYHILPFAVSGLLLMHLVPETEADLRSLFGMRPKAGSRNIVIAGGRSRGSLALRRLLMVTAVAIGPVTMDMPVALHLYWASSVGCSLIVTKGVRRLLPIPRMPVKACSGLEIPLIRPKPN